MVLENITLITSIHKILNGEKIRRCGVSRIHKNGDRKFITPDARCCLSSNKPCESCDYLIITLDQLKRKILFNSTQKEKSALNNHLLNWFPIEERFNDKVLKDTIQEIINLEQEDYEKQIKEYLKKET